MKTRTIILLTAIFCLSTAYAEDGHNHDHSDHNHKSKKVVKKVQKKKKKKTADKSHDHSHESHSKSAKQEEHSHGKDHDHDEHDSIEEQGHSHDDHAHDTNEDSHKHDSHADHKDEHGSHGDSDDGHGHDSHGAEAFGTGKAITEVFNEGEKFKLSADSEALLKIKTTPLSSRDSNSYVVKNAAIVRYQGKIGVFIKRDGWFQLIELKTAKKVKATWIIKGTQFKSSDAVVIGGIPLLRVAHLQASGQGGQGHVH